jgi:hypothetical protein
LANTARIFVSYEGAGGGSLRLEFEWFHIRTTDVNSHEPGVKKVAHRSPQAWNADRLGENEQRRRDQEASVDSEVEEQ